MFVNSVRSLSKVLSLGQIIQLISDVHDIVFYLQKNMKVMFLEILQSFIFDLFSFSFTFI
jgi:hypothetical protein